MLLYKQNITGTKYKYSSAMHMMLWRAKSCSIAWNVEFVTIMLEQVWACSGELKS